MNRVVRPTALPPGGEGQNSGVFGFDKEQAMEKVTRVTSSPRLRQERVLRGGRRRPGFAAWRAKRFRRAGVQP